MEFPKIKKEVKSFLLGEEGKISKKNILKVGAILALAAAASPGLKEVSADHGNVGCCRGTHKDVDTSWFGDSHGNVHINVDIPANHANDMKILFSSGTADGQHINAESQACKGSSHADSHSDGFLF